MPGAYVATPRTPHELVVVYALVFYTCKRTRWLLEEVVKTGQAVTVRAGDVPDGHAPLEHPAPDV